MARISFRYLSLMLLVFFAAAAVPSGSGADEAVTVPAGTGILVKMQSAVVTGEARKGDPFTAVLEEPVAVNGKTVFARGLKVHGRVVEAVDTGNISGRPAMALNLTEIETKNGTVPIRTLSQGFIGTAQGTVNSGIAGKVVGPAGPGVVVDSTGRVTVKPGALIEFGLLDPVEVNEASGQLY